MKVDAKPYPHLIQNNFTQFNNEELSKNFPTLDIFGKTIRMDGDLSSHDIEFQKFVS